MKSLSWIIALVFSFSATTLAQNGGYTLKFDGIDGAVSAIMNTGNTNSTMTLEFWFTQVAAQAGTHYMADLHSISGTDRRRVMPYLNSGQIGVFAAPNTGNDINSIDQLTGVTVTPGAWYHVAVTINGSIIKEYVNGKLYVTTSLTDSYALTGTEVLTLATDYWNSAYANIAMDEIRVWSSERTEAQINANMFKELVGNEAGLLSYYKMSDGAGVSLSDNQTAGLYTGTISGGASWTVSGAFADSRNALDFDGSNDYVICGNGASVQMNGTQSFTLEAWVKPNVAQWGAVISKFQHTAAHEGYSLEILSDNRVSLLLGNNWSDWDAVTSTNPVTPGVWNHIAATYDGSTVKIYINGRLDTSSSWTNGMVDSGTDLYLGCRMGTTEVGTFFSGQMDEARVWTVARTQAQLRENMCKTMVGNEANLAAYFRLDESDGTTAYDVTSNANNGTLTNMTPLTDWVASAAFNTWLGSESTSWSTAGNWSKGAVPVAANNVGIYKWALGNEVTISTSPTIAHMCVSSTSTPTLSSSLTVNGNLMLEKNFDLNGQAVTLGSTSFLLEGTGRLYGSSGTISTTRNLSNISALDVASLGANITTAANMGATTITRGHTQQTGRGNYSILRYYDITPTNNSNLNATLVFNYNDAELNTLTETNLELYKSSDSGATWIQIGGTLSTANNTVTSTAVSSFSRWTLGDTTLSIANTPPTGADNSVSMVQNTSHTFVAGEFTYNDDEGDLFSGIQIVSLETAGDLKYNGADVTAGLDCPDVTLLVFTPAVNTIASPYATFTFKVKDSAGNYSSATYTMTINVTTPPQIPTLNEWGAIMLSALLLLAGIWEIRRKHLPVKV